MKFGLLKEETTFPMNKSNNDLWLDPSTVLQNFDIVVSLICFVQFGQVLHRLLAFAHLI